MPIKIITVKSTTATTVSAEMTDGEGDYFVGETLTLYNSDKSAVIGTAVITGNPSPSSPEEIPVATFTGLSPETTYYVYYDLATGYVVATTTEDSPKVATESMWADLASKVKAKSGATITMTTTDPGEGSALAENNYIGVYGGDPIIMDYSTSEVNTGMKWIDGSAIYKKTINVGAVATNTPASVNHNISSLGIFIKSEAWGSSGNVQDGYSWYSIPWVAPSHGISITITETEVGILSSDFSLDQSYVTLYYTKSS